MFVDPHLEVHRLRDPAVPRRPAGRARRAHRGRRDRRRELVADPAAHHLPLLGPTIRIWAFLSIIGVAAAVRHGLGHHRRRPASTRPSTMATYMVEHGQFGGQLRLRQRRRRHPVRHLARRRAALPALRAAPRHRRRHHRRECADDRRPPSPHGADAPAPSPRARRTPRFDWGQPLVYFVALVVVGGHDRPGALRHPRRLPHQRADLNADPAGLPDPWTVENYADVLTQRATSGAACSTRRSSRSAPPLGVVVARPHGRLRARPLHVPRARGAVRALRRRAAVPADRRRSLPLYILLRNLGPARTPPGRDHPADRVRAADHDHHPGAVPAGDPRRARGGRRDRRHAARSASSGASCCRCRCPGVVTVGVLAFVGSWNGYLLPLLILSTGTAAGVHRCRSACRRSRSQYSSTPRACSPSRRWR